MRHTLRRSKLPLLPVLLVGLFPVLLSACSEGGSESGVAGEAPLRLELEASYPEPFSFLTGIRELPGGRVLAADPLSQVLLSIDLVAGTADTLGGVGPGPQEYEQPDRVLWMPGDSTLLVDLGNTRLTVVAPDGTFSSAFSMVHVNEEGDASVMFPRHLDARGHIYYRSQAVGPSALRDSAAVLRLDRATGRIDTVGVVKLAERERRDLGDRISLALRPFSPQDGWAVARDGRVALVRSGDFSVALVAPDGSTVVGPPQEYEPVRVGQGEKEEWVDGRLSGGLAMSIGGRAGPQLSMRRTGGSDRDPPPIESYNWPDVLPPFRAGSIAITPSGDLWVERYVPSGAAPVMDIFDSSGERTYSVSLPEGRQLIGFGDGTVYLTRTDHVGLVWLERYRLLGGAV